MVIKMSDIGQLCPDVLGAYLRDYSLRLSASEISKDVKIGRRTVSRIMNRLVEVGFMDYVLQGKNKLFYFDLNKNNSFSLLNYSEINKSINFGLKNKEIYLIISKLVSVSDAVIVFGSYAKGKNKKGSDLDVVLLGNVNLNELKKIKDLSLVEINEHIVSFSEFKKILKSKNPLSLEISNSHVLFGNFSKIVNIFLEDKLNG